MNAGRYTLKSFLTDHNLDQIIIPEIQRDYVWNSNNVMRFLETILENSKRQLDLVQGITEELLNQLPPQAREAIVREQEKNQVYCNVGFIYAYFDPELAGRFILVDGQQRMTTLFLALLAISVKEEKQDLFRRAYYKDGSLKFDYKVRETSHEFVLNFVDFILNGKNINDITNQHWYFSEYKNDITIQSILTNYSVIKDFIEKFNLPLYYIEDFVEFWYFDTNKSKQGEELYLYMNSRGETVSPNESVKANLLKGLSDQEKHDWGIKWEEWQNFFWRHKGINKNADNGIEEFLRWIKIIELTLNDNSIDSQAKNIRQIKETKKIELKGLSLKLIEHYFHSLSKLVEYRNDVKFNVNWLIGYDISGIDYIKFIPLLMYAKKYPDCDILDIKRFSRFFNNVTRFSDVSKSPYHSLVHSINITREFLDKGYVDIFNIIEFQDNYKIFLTEEEVGKLSIYKQSTDSIRSEIESAFWSAEDYKYCDGKIWFIWLCIDYDVNQKFNHETLSLFTNTFENFKILFDIPDDLVRRALLTKGNYSVHDGYSTSLEKYRYSFINEEYRWKEQLSLKNKINPFKLLVQEYGNRKTNDKTKDITLNEIIKEYIDNSSQENWVYYFISNPEVLSYCGDKKICWSDDLRYIALLQRTKVMDSNWCYLKNKVKIHE